MQKTTLTFIFTFISILFGFAQTSASYTITINTTWDATLHSSIPNNAHWSNLVGATHNAQNEFIELGVNATEGVKNVAELGSNTVFSAEVQNAINNSRADQWLQEPFSPFDAISSSSIDVTVIEQYHYITLISMVAPSPDWFIAINSLDLRDNDNWKDTFTIDVFAYDAGTDSGTDYTSSDLVTNPAEPISKIEGLPINGNKIATATFTLNEVLSTQPINEKSISIFPNPSNDGIFKINNSESIKELEVFDILGKRVLSKSNLSKDNISIDLSDESKGVYLLRVKNDRGTTTRKLIVQ